MRFDVSERLFKYFDPQKPLRREDAALYVKRADSVVARLVQHLRFPDSQRFALVGAVGSGKSTELYRAFEEMQNDKRYVTVLLDLYAQFRVDDLTAGQVLFLVALSILRATGVDAAKSTELVEHLRTAYLGVVEDAQASELDITKLLKGLATMVAGVALGPVGAAAANAAGEAAEALDLTVSLPGRGKALRPNEASARRLEDALKAAVIEGRRAADGRRLLVLVDGLDKIRDHDRVYDLFCGGILQARDVHGLDLVYTAPPSVAFEVGLRGGLQTLRLGVFNIFRRDGGTIDEEVEAMRAMLEKRVEAAGLSASEVWPDGSAAHPSVTRAIRASGGLTRDLIHIVRRAIVRASADENERCFRASDIEGGVQDQAKEYLLRLDLDVENLLREAWIEKQRPGGDKVPSLLNDNFLLYYENGQPWCRPHPLVMGRLHERFPQNIGAADVETH